MGQMIDVLVSVGSCNFYLCSCEMSLVHLDGLCIPDETHSENGYYKVLFAVED